MESTKKVVKPLLPDSESNSLPCQILEGGCRVEELTEELPQMSSLPEKGHALVSIRKYCEGG